MIDIFSLGLTHALMLIALWRLATRPAGDADEAAATRPWGSRDDA